MGEKRRDLNVTGDKSDILVLLCMVSVVTIVVNSRMLDINFSTVMKEKGYKDIVLLVKNLISLCGYVKNMVCVVTICHVKFIKSRFLKYVIRFNML